MPDNWCSRGNKGQSGVSGKVCCPDTQKEHGLETVRVDWVALTVNTVSPSKIEQTSKVRANKGSSDGKSWWMAGEERAARNKEA